MLDVVKVASYISRRYEREYGSQIDEMKLHKLLYFAQRESLIQLDQPLFAESFQAWKYGPVLVQIRSLYKHGEISWQKARMGIPAGENSDTLIALDDIRKDAHHIKLRRYYLSHLQPSR